MPTLERVLDPGLLVRVDRVAGVLECDRDHLLVAAVARAVATSRGASGVDLVLVTAGGRHHLRVGLERSSWTVLVSDVARGVAASAPAGPDLSTDPGAAPDVAVVAAGAGPVPGLRLAVGLEHGVLQLQHDPAHLDEDAAGRLAGYVERALAAASDDPTAPTTEAWLVDAAELDLQRRLMCGPLVPLPEARLHDLLLERVEEHPDRVAVACGGWSLTYRELAHRSHQVAHALLRDGLEPEQVVAVVAERDPSWVTAVLGVLAAGGVYLPLDPALPADRVATTLRRAECGVVLTQRGFRDVLDTALARPEAPRGVRRLLLEDVPDGARAWDGVVPDVHVEAHCAAYVAVTAGRAGRPVGALVEHAGLLNQVLAKVDDLPLGERAVVAQLGADRADAPLWPLLAPLLVGGRVVLVGPRTGADDPTALVRLLVDEGVQVLATPTTTFEAVLDHVETHLLAPPDLWVVALTGASPTTGLADKARRTLGDVSLVHGHGRAETSGDALDAAGVPLRNVAVALVDRELRPVPLGAPGEVVFSGVCVGRGYVDDPRSTAAAFAVDPLRPGTRLHRSGERGRWSPTGGLVLLEQRTPPAEPVAPPAPRPEPTQLPTPEPIPEPTPEPTPEPAPVPVPSLSLVPAPAAPLLAPIARTGLPTSGRVLVCLPPGADDVSAFGAVAADLLESGVALVAARPEPDAAGAVTVDRLVAELLDLDRGCRVSLWGQAAGAAVAAAVALRLEQAGRPAERLFVGSSVPGSSHTRAAARADLHARTDAELAVRFAVDHGAERLADLGGDDPDQVGAALRHDELVALECYDTVAADAPSGRLRTPVSVVLAADDPLTTPAERRFTEWEHLARQVELVVLPHGGHQFLATQAAAVAHVVDRATRRPSAVSERYLPQPRSSSD